MCVDLGFQGSYDTLSKSPRLTIQLKNKAVNIKKMFAQLCLAKAVITLWTSLNYDLFIDKGNIDFFSGKTIEKGAASF